MDSNECEVAVVGGGLGGMVAAALLARRGLDVVLFERAGTVGGRAATHVRDGFSFNEGAHALYRGGAAVRILSSLGVRWTGKRPPLSGLAVSDGSPYGLPSTTTALFTTALLRWPSKIQGAKLFARLGAIDARAIDRLSWNDWVTRAAPDPAMQAALQAFVRVATYANAPSLLSAGAAIDQLRLAQRPGVLYVDGGWQTLVGGAADAVRSAGARLRSGAHVVCATPQGSRWRVALQEGEPITCGALLLAVGPITARSIVGSDALARWAARAVPTRAACLDVALSRLPDERATFALGIDRPLYLSVHSRTANLAPPGAALVSAMKYSRTGDGGDGGDGGEIERDPERDLGELEAWLDLLQPGWRDVLVARRWLPAMVTSNALVTASSGGTAGRPDPAVPDAPGVFVAGDWVGSEGMLLDASLASAELAASQIAEIVPVVRAPRARIA